MQLSDSTRWHIRLIYIYALIIYVDRYIYIYTYDYIQIQYLLIHTVSKYNTHIYIYTI